MSLRCRNGFFGMTALLLGALCYIFFREQTFLASYFTHFPVVRELREILFPLSSAFFRYYFPDFLWAFSLSCGLYVIYVPNRKEMLICSSVAVVCGVTWECLQYCGAISGTGDFFDVLMYISAGIIHARINLKERTQ